MIPLGMFADTTPEEIPAKYAAWILNNFSEVLTPKTTQILQAKIAGIPPEELGIQTGQGNAHQRLVEEAFKRESKGLEKDDARYKSLVALRDRLVKAFKHKKGGEG